MAPERLLAGDAATVVFQRHYTASPDPRRAVPALLTGRLDPAVGPARTLPEVFAEAHWRTVAVAPPEGAEQWMRTLDPNQSGSIEMMPDSMLQRAR